MVREYEAEVLEPYIVRHLEIPVFVPHEEPQAKRRIQNLALEAISTHAALPDALDTLEEDAPAERGPDLVGLSLYHCVNELIRHPELMARVRKIVCEEWPTDRMGKKQREVIDALAGRLYYPKREGRVHHMPAGNPGYTADRLPSRWWITNSAYRKVLTGKLRNILREMKDRGLV